MIQCHDVTIGYGGQCIQSGLSFSLKQGELICLLGPNGCGKSTLLRTLAGLQPTLSGSIVMGAEHPIVMNGRAECAKEIALVLTERVSLENTSVHDVVAMGRYPYTSFFGGLTPQDEQIVYQSLEAVGLLHIAHTYFNAHSDGEKQRVLIAKAIAQQTPIILLDEPTAHLDLPNRIRILKLLQTLAHTQNKTILISTHELELAKRVSDRALLMWKNGAVLDTIENLQKQELLSIAFEMDLSEVGYL